MVVPFTWGGERCQVVMAAGRATVDNAPEVIAAGRADADARRARAAPIRSQRDAARLELPQAQQAFGTNSFRLPVNDAGEQATTCVDVAELAEWDYGRP